MSGENGILSRATQAKEKTEEAEREETETLSDYEGIMEQYVGEPLANKVEVGDYIKYGEKLTAKTYTTDTNETGYTTGTQNFETDTDMLWRVMSKKAKGEVEIVAVSNVLADDGATGLYLYGETGFVNAETVLKNLCSTLYTSSYGEARSINVDDINALTGYTPEATTSYTYTSGKFWDKASNTFKTATTADQVTVKRSYYSYTVVETMPLYDTLIQESTTYTGDYSETNYPLFYWLGSRSAYARVNSADFNVRTVVGGDVSDWTLVNAQTTGRFNEYVRAFGVRPVVTLKSNIQIEETTATGGVTTWVIK